MSPVSTAPCALSTWRSVSADISPKPMPTVAATTSRRGMAARGGSSGCRRAASTAPAVTPAHQYPTGVTLDPGRRAQLAGWASDVGGLVIEDDYDGEFRYDRQPVGATQGLAPGRVVYAGTAGKTLAPGLRLAWLALPADLVEEIVELRRPVDRHPIMSASWCWPT